jgi:glucose/mannose-6-phosphate isomerase
MKLAGARSLRVDLDDPASWARLDPGGMVRLALGFPEQCEEALRIGDSFSPPASLRRPDNIALAGMGGSAIAGDLLARLYQYDLRVPFLICRHYEIPRFVGPGTLFIASSNSGNTEETIAATRAALRRRARVVCITSGGKLAELARARRLPLLQIPAGLPPRAATGYGFLPLVRLLEKLRLVPGRPSARREAVARLKRLRARLRPAVPTRRNPAKQLARYFHRRFPWIYGTHGIMSAVAFRWQTQANENSKSLAFHHELAELNHNEIVGWGLSPALARKLAVVILRRNDDHPRLLRRIEITKQIIGRKAEVREVAAEGKSALAQLLWMMYLGDFASLYLAFLNRADPIEIEAINYLKAELGKD